MTASTVPFPRLLLVNLARKFGGAEVRVLELARAFRPEGSLIACLAASPLAQKARAAGLEVSHLSSSKLDPRIPGRLSRLIQKGSFGLVDFHNVQSYFWAYPLLRSVPDRAVFAATVHSSIQAEQKSRLKGQLNHAIARASLPRFDLVITVSRYLCAELEHDGVSPGRIHRVPNGVQMPPSSPVERAVVRQEFGIAPGALLIGAIGRLEPAKGIDIMLLALGQLLPLWPDLRCLVVGDGSQAARLVEMVRQLGLEKQVIFAGFRDDVARLLPSLDIFVLPSRTEGIPISLLEAGCAGLPCVASRVGGVPEILTHGQSGLLVAPEDPGLLFQAIDCLLRDRALAQKLGGAAAGTITSSFTMQRMIEGTRAAYTAACAAREVIRR